MVDSQMPIYIIETHLREWISKWVKKRNYDQVEEERKSKQSINQKSDTTSPWDEVGLSEWSGNTLVDRLMTNFANLPLRLGNDVVFHNLENDNNVKDCIKLFKGLSDKTNFNFNDYIASSQRDWSTLRDKFNDSWFCPSLNKESIEKLEQCVNELKKDHNTNTNAELLEIINTVLGEANFYNDLHKYANDSTFLECNKMTRESWAFGCYRFLVFKWVIEGSLLPCKAPNLYSLEFWDNKDAVMSLAKELAEAFVPPCGITNEQKGEYLNRIKQKLEDALLYSRPGTYSTFGDYEDLIENDDDFKLLEDVWKRKPSIETDDYESPFDIKESCDNDALQWAKLRAELIVLIMAPAFLGTVVIDGEYAPTNGTKDWSFEKSANQVNAQSPNLGSGSGIVPLIQDGATRVTATLDLSSQDKKDGLVCLIGRHDKDNYWTEWKNLTKLYIQKTFIAIEKILKNKIFGALEKEISNCGLKKNINEETEANLRSCIEKQINEHLRTAAAGKQGQFTMKPGSVFIFGSMAQKKINMEKDVSTLAGALKLAAEDCNNILLNVYNRSTSNKDKPSYTSIATKFIKELDTFRNIQICKTSNRGKEPILLASLDCIKKEYSKKYPNDPSFDFLLIELKNKLTGALRDMTKELDYEELCKNVDKAFEQYISRERSCYANVADGQVSRRHLILYLQDGKLYATDVGSQNGSVIIRKDGTGYLLNGNERTNVDNIKNATWFQSNFQEIDYIQLQRGDELHLGANTVIKVG